MNISAFAADLMGTILNDSVEIYVLHGARDYEPILFPNE
jgi:hypothetical protein